ncbi:hypothetical protein WNY78_18480, partial [Psychroserpens sp. AS72]|uniref:hypothetical protein n=1 Tax=Psychroserpens sp. AS72 TaxID=3135775 RepID=UPI00316D68CA
LTELEVAQKKHFEQLYITSKASIFFGCMTMPDLLARNLTELEVAQKKHFEQLYITSKASIFFWMYDYA